MPHDHSHDPSAPGLGHNHADLEHLRSHMLEADDSEAVQALATQFIEGFWEASDKAAYLRLAGVPLEVDSAVGGAPLKLVDVAIETKWQVGAASPAFGSAELSYLPYPGSMIRERTQCRMVYVSLTERRDVDLRAFLGERV